MRIINHLAIALVVFMLTSVAYSGTLEEVKKRGKLHCVVATGLAGFAAPDKKGNWKGFDIDFCRAVAAAVLGDANKVKFIPSTAKTRFTLLNSGQGDILFRNTTETLTRDVDLKLTYLPVTYYDGQGFLLRKSLGVKSARELNGASICVPTGTTTELNIADYFRTHNMKYRPVNTETNEESITSYAAERCDVYTTDKSALASSRAALKDPSAHVILPETISKEPLAGAVRQGDEQWADIGKWVVNAIIIAEELGVSSKNVRKLVSKPGKKPSINRLLGNEGDIGKMLGLDKRWAVNAISAVGNYGEIFDRNIGSKSPIGLDRGLNASWKNGGILYAAPIR